MIRFLNQNCTHKSCPILDKFGQASGWKSVQNIKCRFIASRSMSMDSKQRLQVTDAIITTTEPLKLGDVIVYDCVEYEVYSSQEWRTGDKSYGNQSKLILV
jgi:hypothetical protein